MSETSWGWRRRGNGGREGTWGVRGGQRCGSLIQANAISVTVQTDHMTQSHYCPLFIYPDTRTHIIPACHTSCRAPHTCPPTRSLEDIQTHTCTCAPANCAFPRVCLTREHISQRSHASSPPPSLVLFLLPVYGWIQASGPRLLMSSQGT